MHGFCPNVISVTGAVSMTSSTVAPYTFGTWKGGIRPPDGWDVADAVEDGWSKDQIDAFMRATVKPWQPDDPEPGGDPRLEPPIATLDDVPAPKQGNRPMIYYVDAELPTVVNEACRAVASAEVDLYARGTGLFRPVKIDTPALGRVSRVEGATILVPVSKPALVEIFTAYIDWRKYDSRLKASAPWKPVSCPPIVAETVIARQGDWPFPQLRAVVSAPTLRPDGTLLDRPGFDRSTGILFASDVEWPKLRPKPTREDAESALNDLRVLIGTFPFVTDADRSAAVAMIMTALARPCLPTAPMFGISAPTPGTGKSKLVDVAAILATGQAAAVMSASRDEVELQKQVGSALMAGDQFITLDNIEHPLRSEFLCQVLTQGTVAVRVLGESKTLKLPTTATLCSTGNSLRFAGDLTRRVVLINLDARIERPEERLFDEDVTATARDRRVELVGAALTVLRAFIVQQGARIAPPLGSFEAWSNLVRSALVWLGEADPLLNAEKVRDNDPERERTAAILRALPAGKWRVADIAYWLRQDEQVSHDLRQYGVLAEALAEFMDRNGALNNHKFSLFLRKHQDRIIDSRRVVKSGSRDKISLWSVEDENSPELPQGGYGGDW